MKRIFMMLMICTFLIGEDVGSLFVGYSTFGSDQYLPPLSYQVENGYSLGLLLPIRVPYLDMHYKVRAAFHPVDAIYAVGPGRLNYISAQNTMLCGKAIYSSHFETLLLPQIGLGLLYENIYGDWGTGYLYNLLFVDLSIRISLPELTDNVEIMINRELGIESSIKDYLPQRRTNFSLILTY